MWFFIVEKNLNEPNLSFCSENPNESRIQKLVNRTGLRLSPEVHSKKIGGVIDNTVISLIVGPGYATMTSTYHTNSVLVCCNILHIAVFVFSVLVL